MERYAGEFLDGLSPVASPVVVLVEADAITVLPPASDDPLAIWPLAGLKVEPLGAGLVHVQHPDAGDALLTSRDAGLAAALKTVGFRATVPGGRRLWRVGLAFGAGLVAAIIAVYASLPAVTRWLAHQVPLHVEERLGLQIERFFREDLCPDSQAQRGLDHLVARLGGDSSASGPRRVSIVKWDMINAFTLPGGTILLTQGFLDEAEGPDEIAGVLAHELEHVRQRHIMTQIIRGSIISLGWAITVGDFSGLMVVDPTTAFSIANQRFSRDAEREADQGALDRLDAAGIGRKGFAAFFERVKEATDGVPAWLSTHPPSDERLARINATAKGAATKPALSADVWQDLKTACAGKKKASPASTASTAKDGEKLGGGAAPGERRHP